MKLYLKLKLNKKNLEDDQKYIKKKYPILLNPVLTLMSTATHKETRYLKC